MPDQLRVGSPVQRHEPLCSSHVGLLIPGKADKRDHTRHVPSGDDAAQCRQRVAGLSMFRTWETVGMTVNTRLYPTMTCPKSNVPSKIMGTATHINQHTS